MNLPDQAGELGEGLLLPVGMPLGFFSMVTPSQLGSEVAEIRHGERRRQLAPDLYELWTQIAHLGTRGEVRGWADARGITNAEEALADLIDAGLVVELQRSSQQDLQTLAAHRLLPLGFGLGNTSAARTVFHVADQRGEVLHSMSGLGFGLWSLSDGYMSVREACETAAKLFAVARNDALGRIAEELAGIVVRGAGILDVLGGAPRSAAA